MSIRKRMHRREIMENRESALTSEAMEKMQRAYEAAYGDYLSPEEEEAFHRNLEEQKNRSIEKGDGK